MSEEWCRRFLTAGTNSEPITPVCLVKRRQNLVPQNGSMGSGDWLMVHFLAELDHY
jgi:hypothetical protein